MECKTFELTASAYLDRQLTDTETVACQAHLASCGNCRLHLAEVEQASLMLRELPLPETPRELHGYVMGEVASRAHKEISLEQRGGAPVVEINTRLVAPT